jgi:two-component system, sensor histidine kinase and response regulator
VHAAPNRTILVAEDNEVSRQLLMHQLAVLGRPVIAVADGHEAIRAWRSGDFALLLTDLEMPGLNGYEVARLIRSGTTRVEAPIILLTAGKGSPRDQHGDETVIDDVLIKPASLATLRVILEQWLGPVVAAPVEEAPP